MNRKSPFRWVGLFFLSLLFSGLMAQNSDDPKEVTSTYFIKNAFVVQKPGMVMSNTHLIIRDGLITQVGKNLSAPFDAQVIEADSMYVYAGFIDAASHTGIPKSEESNSRQRPKVDDPGNPPNDLAGITPDVKASDVMKTSEKSIAAMREKGFTISHILPEGRMLPGKGAIISNREGEASSLLVTDETALYSQFRTAPRIFPATVIGIISKWKDLYYNARNHSQYEESYAMDPAGKKRPEMDAATAAMVPVVKGELPVFFKTGNVLEIHRAIKLAGDLGFNLVLTEVEQVYPVVDVVKSKNIPVLLSIDLPEEEKKKEKEDEKEKDQEKNELQKRKAEAIKKHLEQAAMLEKAGVKFAFSFIDGKVKDFRDNIKRMIANGLSEEAALEAMTVTPAQLMGISRQAGTIEAGKMAHLVITDQPYFAEKSNIRYVFVDGKMHEYEVKKKKESGGKPAAVAGTWTYEIEIPGQTMGGKMVITKSGDDYEIKFASNQDPDTFNEGENVSLSGSNLTFDASVSAGPNEIPVSYDIEFDGDTFDGTITAGQFGSFPVTGDKIGDPE